MLRTRHYDFKLLYHTLARVDPIACGILLSSLWLGCDSPIWRRLRSHRILVSSTGVLLWSVSSLLWRIPESTTAAMLVYPLVSIASASFLIAAIGSSWMANKYTAYFGRISYGLYIWHGAIMALFAALFAASSWMLVGCTALPATMAVSAASYQWLESPFLRLKRRFEYIPSRAT